ncbi:hypothetical protein Trydic_g1681 [Trypoxylus dichotomus]
MEEEKFLCKTTSNTYATGSLQEGIKRAHAMTCKTCLSNTEGIRFPISRTRLNIMLIYADITLALSGFPSTEAAVACRFYFRGGDERSLRFNAAQLFDFTYRGYARMRVRDEEIPEVAVT